MFQTLGPLELLIILLIVIALFGAGRIAGVGRALGTSVREFRREAGTGKAGEDEGEGEEEDQGTDDDSASDDAPTTVAGSDASGESEAEEPRRTEPDR